MFQDQLSPCIRYTTAAILWPKDYIVQYTASDIHKLNSTVNSTQACFFFISISTKECKHLLLSVLSKCVLSR